MTENKRFHYDSALEKIYDYNTCEDGITESLDCFDACELLNELNNENYELKNENEELKQSVNNLKNTIIKITIAYQRKYDRAIVKLVNEVYDGDINDLIKELKE